MGAGEAGAEAAAADRRLRGQLAPGVVAVAARAGGPAPGPREHRCAGPRPETEVEGRSTALGPRSPGCWTEWALISLLCSGRGVLEEQGGTGCG